MTIHVSKNAARTAPGRRRRRVWRRVTWSWALVVLGGVMLLSAIGAYAGIALSGTGTVLFPAARTQGLQVTQERVSGPLIPGGSADLLFAVRNPNTFPVTVNRVGLASSLRSSSPARCTTKLTGPLLAGGGYSLPAGERVLVPPGARRTVIVHRAVRLAASARTGCAFAVDVLAQATQVIPVPTATTRTPIPPGHPPITTAPPALEPTTAAPTATDPPTDQPPAPTGLPDPVDADPADL